MYPDLKKMAREYLGDLYNEPSLKSNTEVPSDCDLYKKLKTSENIKPIVNFDISYQGGKFDNIDQLSGGEGDRASIALTLALKRLSSCPILMLDESLASLDLDIKETTINSIRENITDTVIIIMHDGIEGIFDDVINVNDLR